MKKLTFDLIPKDIRSRKLDQQRKINCIEYLNLFVETFNDRFMANTFSKIHKSAWLSVDQAINIEKRSANIILTPDISKNALRYIVTYWKMLLPLKIAIAHSQFRPRCSQLIIKKSNTMLPFFETFGYLSKAQFEAFLRPGTGTFPLKTIEYMLATSTHAPSIIKEMRELFRIIISKIDKIIASNLFKIIPAKWTKRTCLEWLGSELTAMDNAKLTTINQNTKFNPFTIKDIEEIKRKSIKKTEYKPMSLKSFREQFEV